MSAALSSKVAIRGQAIKASPVAKSTASAKAVTVAQASSRFSEKSNKAAAVALAAVVATGAFAAPEAAYADVAGLTPCAKSKAFAKREKQELKGLKRRLAKYEEGSAPALALQATMDQTSRRFKMYGDQGLLCGADGYPHLIVDGDWNHAGEITYPGLAFLYIAGWIGWVGREYLLEAKKDKKPTAKEIIIDVPYASSLMWSGATWPIAAFNSLKNGDLLEKDENITVSPR